MSNQLDPSFARQVLTDPVHLLAFGFGSGLGPWAPGTWGSLLAVLAYALVMPVPPIWLAVTVVVLFVLGIWICGVSSRRLGVHDHGGIVWDEIVGMLAVCLVVPPAPIWLLVGFLAFRLFDIWKPWPIRDLDHSVSGGLGIMLDDVLAAVYAALLTVLLQRFFAAL